MVEKKCQDCRKGLPIKKGDIVAGKVYWGPNLIERDCLSMLDFVTNPSKNFVLDTEKIPAKCVKPEKFKLKKS